MRAFVLSCLLGLAVAAPQGYNYQAQQSGRLQLPGIPQIGEQLLQQALVAPQLQQALGAGTASSSVNYNAVSAPQQLIYQQQQQQHRQQQLGFGLQQQGSGFGFNALAQPQLQPQQLQQVQQSYSPNSLVSKDIYVHVPPAEEEERLNQPQVPVVVPPRKHYRIVFIKAPTPGVTKAALRVKQAPVEEKTIIYVLTRKPDPVDLQAALEEAAPKPPSKPEVFFIKYKTQEEAAHAQRTIQAQYDQLGGTTQVSDEGIAPVTSVIGSLDNQRAGAASNVNANVLIGGGPAGLPNKYLPAHLRA